MFSDRNVADIFPTPLFSYQVEDKDGFNAYVLDFVESVRKEEGWDEESLAGKDETLEHLRVQINFTIAKTQSALSMLVWRQRMKFSIFFAINSKTCR